MKHAYSNKEHLLNSNGDLLRLDANGNFRSMYSMRNFGLLEMDIVLDISLFTKEMQQDLLSMQPYCNGIFMNAFDSDKRKKLNSFDDINLALDTTYIIEYRIDNNNFFIQLYKNYLMISFSKYVDIILSTLLIPMLKKYVLQSNFTLIGFETTLFLDEYPDCISSILSDESLYPLYIKDNIEYVSFRRYSGYEQMQNYIESFLQDIFSAQILHCIIKN